MIGSFLTRGLVMVFGYAYPAYECFKTVEMNKPDIQQLRFWCQYWILVAVLTVCERFFDAFVSWVPMYSEAKLAFFIYLWCPKTKGTTYVYDSFFRPVVLKHETEIDRSLLELRIRAGDMAFLYWQKSANFVQTRIFDILKYIASQSTAHRPSQPSKQQTTKGRQRTAKMQNRRAASPTTKVEAEEEASSASSSDNEAKTTEEAPTEAASPAAVASLGAIPTEALAETTKASSSSDAQVMQIDLVPSSDNQSQKPPVETVMEEAVRVTRARARKTRLAPDSVPDHVSLK